MSHLAIDMVFIDLKHAHIGVFFGKLVVLHPSTNALKQTLASGQLPIIHDEALALPLEHLRLHLQFEVDPQSSFLLSIGNDPALVVLEMTHLPNSGQPLGARFLGASSIRHAPSHHGPTHHAGDVAVSALFGNLVAEGSKAQSVRCIRIVLTAKTRLCLN